MAMLKFRHLTLNVMPGLVPGIHALLCDKEGVDGRNIGERSDAVLRTAMSGHDELCIFGGTNPRIHFGETNPRSLARDASSSSSKNSQSVRRGGRI